MKKYWRYALFAGIIILFAVLFFVAADRIIMEMLEREEARELALETEAYFQRMNPNLTISALYTE